MSLLDIKSLNTFRGAVQVLANVSFFVGTGEIVGIMGRNGAGKSTVLNSIMGLVPAYSGSILFRDHQLVQPEISPEKVTKIVSQSARLGIGLVPEDKRIFPNLSVYENLVLGIKPGAGGKSDWTLERIYALFPKLEKIRGRLGYYLSGGEKQMLSIGRSLLGNPDLLLLDEPSEGIAHSLAMELREQIKRLKGAGVSILICEQNTVFIDGLCDRVIFLELGSIKFQGSYADLQNQSHLAKFNL